MRHLFLLLLLLAPPMAGASQHVSALPVLRMQPAVVAHPVGARASARPRSTNKRGDAEAELVFDSFTGASIISATPDAGNTLIGMPLNLDAAAGSTPFVTEMLVYLVHLGTTEQTFSTVRVRVQMWDAWLAAGEPVFSDAAATLVEYDIPGPITLPPLGAIPVQILPASAIPLSGLTGKGIAVNFQVDTGSGFESSNLLTPGLRLGANPVAIGANALPNSFGYMDFSSRGDFNFNAGDNATFNEPNQALVLMLYATDFAVVGQQITNVVATPAVPLVDDGTFTVSATGGASGNPVVFSIDPASATVCAAGGTNGATISILAAGRCNVLANQAGNAGYTAAPTVTLAVDIVGDALVQDGSFEAGAVPTYWVQASTNFNTPICEPGCWSTDMPRTGDYFAWFGGSVTAEVGSLQQSGKIDPGLGTLEFYVWFKSPTVNPPDPTAVFKVSMDGDTLFTLTPANAAPYGTGYTRVALDVSAYADGNGHTLRFESVNVGSDANDGSLNVYVDDIRLIDATTILIDGFE